jgi:hypothetical protein
MREGSKVERKPKGQTFVLRAGFLCVGVTDLVFGLGFVRHLPWATALWPWPDTPLSYLFLGSVLIAFGCGSLLVAATRAWQAGAGGALAMLIGFGGIAGRLGLLIDRGSGGLIPYAVALALLAAIAGSALMICLRFKDKPGPQLSGPVRASFWLFTCALSLAGAALLLRAPDIFPWPLKPESSIAFGFLFAGLAVNYGYVAIRGTIEDAQVSLIGFLAYDLVLIGPHVRLFGHVKPGHLTSLVIYVAVLVYSAVVAIYALMASPDMRLYAKARG